MNQANCHEDDPTLFPCNCPVDFSAGEGIPCAPLAIRKNTAVLLRVHKNKAIHAQLPSLEQAVSFLRQYLNHNGQNESWSYLKGEPSAEPERK